MPNFVVQTKPAHCRPSAWFHINNEKTFLSPLNQFKMQKAGRLAPGFSATQIEQERFTTVAAQQWGSLRY
jgi:hypothetical protein